MNTDNEEGDIMPLALIVDGCDDDFDLTVPPTSGNEYLMRVRQEAKGCPRVVVADFDSSTYSSKQTVKYKEPSRCLPAPHGMAPSEGWRKVQMADFTELRQKLVRFQALIKQGTLNIGRPNLPSPNDAENWCRLCFGRLKIKMEQGDSDQTPEPMVQGGPELSLADYDIQDQSPASENSLQGTPPLLSILLFMDQQTVLRVLEYHVNWLEATGFTSHQGRWFYSLLACLEKPLVPEASSLIRGLARMCSNLRVILETATDPRLMELNLIICLVSQYFEQRDLAI